LVESAAEPPGKMASASFSHVPQIESLMYVFRTASFAFGYAFLSAGMSPRNQASPSSMVIKKRVSGFGSHTFRIAYGSSRKAFGHLASKSQIRITAAG